MKIIISENEEFKNLDEIVLSIKNIDELILFKKFLTRTIEDMENGDFFGHRHFQDFIENEKIDYELPEIIIHKI